MEYNKTLDYLNTLRPTQFRMELDPMVEVCHQMGQPQLAFPSVHIAGTNGKGSTAAFLNSILIENGFKTGMLTSPHLIDVRERIQLNGKIISKEKFAEISDKIRKNLATPNQLSYFEFLTLISYLYFFEEKVDVAVIETGLGGRLDATNIVKTEVAVITSISLDHQKTLGSKLEDIAREKCGIIKRGAPTISALQTQEVFEIIKRTCDDVGSPLILVDPISEQKELGIVGEHQRQNASCAVEAARMLANIGIEVKDFDIGLKKAKWPGRLEILSAIPRVIVDGAHNEAGAEVLATYISKNVPKSNAVLVLGSLSDKDIYSICRKLVPVVSKVVCVAPQSDRAASPKDLAAAVRSFGTNVEIADNVKNALDTLLPKVNSSETVFVTGSLTTVGEAISYFKKEIE